MTFHNSLVEVFFIVMSVLYLLIKFLLLLLLIGDSINDYEAAKVNGISFFGYNNKMLIQKGAYIEKFS